MREIIFRAKTINGEWVEGLLSQCDKYWYISNRAHVPFAYEVRPETVGQYTGLKDKNGDRIFTSHIVTIFGIKFTVIFECGSFGLATRDFIEYKPFEERIFEITGCNNRPRYTYNDNFIPLWEIYWNFNCEDDSIELIEIIGNIHDKD